MLGRPFRLVQATFFVCGDRTEDFKRSPDRLSLSEDEIKCYNELRRLYGLKHGSRKDYADRSPDRAVLSEDEIAKENIADNHQKVFVRPNE